MAKRTLGLGKAAKQRKKQKSETPEVDNKINKKNEAEEDSNIPQPKSNEITVELTEEVDADDELAQLKGLWNTFINSERDNELVINGIVHECDRLLRNQKDDNKLPAEFHSIYAISLSELAVFHTDDETDGKTIKDYFEAALERIELGQETYPNSIELKFAKSRILISRIPLEYISKLDLQSEDKLNLTKILDEALKNYEEAETIVKESKKFELLDINTFEILKALDDLLDIVQNFGKEDIAEGLDSDAEEDEEDQEIKLSKKHPLYKLRNKHDEYFKWLIKHGETFGLNIISKFEELKTKNEKELKLSELQKLEFFKSTFQEIGKLFLQASEKPSQIFTTITYDSEVEDDLVIEGYSAKDAQQEAIEYTKKAITYLEKAEDEEEPQTWVDVAEAIIGLGNLYDYESKEQESNYEIAEKKLRRANNATNGKYQKILDNLLNDE
ncbi:hypothetical protein BN7_2606 [Wickerhamomyces ciferrii]|uniref:Enhancer of translation termination 1 n=1 Tax=Wickerhamomyces ciferrii (strain ATCC 14091 / BCRC 22168 / CBS 111 / JCM 3599 / NBRC 0793 / NRRL Y-1031 F-60-10) TaxID=1206466 RepID=K0KNT1_WICCF|nr:uncharacterized protein BN7_2606 [Wickerhamomyces ciferrii]CCH43059.1 hypothetical protein BN7_2606 [Wickerhamomyces ciferrii]